MNHEPTDDLENALRRDLHREIVAYDPMRADEMIAIATRREPTVHRVNAASLAAAAAVLVIGGAAALFAEGEGSNPPASAAAPPASTSSAAAASPAATTTPESCTDTGKVQICYIKIHWTCPVPLGATGTPSPSASGPSRYSVEVPAHVITVHGSHVSRIDFDPPPNCHPGSGSLGWPAKYVPVSSAPTAPASSAPATADGTLTGPVLTPATVPTPTN